MRLALLALLIPATASAGGFEVLDRGDAVEVIAHDVIAKTTAILPVRSRLEVPLAGHPQLPHLTATDATVKLVELEDGRLSVKLGFEHPAVARIAHFAQAIQVGPDVHILLPRAVPAEGAAIVLPQPTIPAELAIKPEPKPAEVKPVDVKPEPKVDAKPDVAPAITVEPPKVTEAPKPLAPELKKPVAPKAKEPAPDDAWQKLAMYGAIGLAGVGCGAWLLKKKRAAQGPLATIEVIAQKSLGGKAKVVWFSAGGREMVVAVTPQHVRMLDSWAKPDVRGRLPAALAVADAKPTSAAVSGIRKLREKAFAAADEPEVDADSAWAREILAATGAHR